MSDYAAFLERKAQLDGDHGFDPHWLPDVLFPFQSALVSWALRKGRGAIFADCGLGKSLCELVWAENVARETGKPVLILTPLAVTYQMTQEAAKFGIEAVRSERGEVEGRIVVANYERLHHFSPDDFSGIVCDESSILKNVRAVTRASVQAFSRKMPYRLLATATPAPNDFVELGTSSEVLGYIGFMDMLDRFFKNDANNSETSRVYGAGMKWRFKGHAEQPFWRWVSSWARAMRLPSDLGFADDGFILPPLRYRENLVKPCTHRQDALFDLPAVGFYEVRQERKRTTAERCEAAAALVNDTGQPAIVWCHRNDEGDALERLITDAVQVSGRDSDDAKEGKLLAFARNQERVLVTKPVIGAWGLNLQHCNHLVMFPDYSFEQHYQAVRRCWRFGQERPVTVDIVTTEAQSGVLAILERKQRQAEQMFAALVAHMHDAQAVARRTAPEAPAQLPAWLVA